MGVLTAINSTLGFETKTKIACENPLQSYEDSSPWFVGTAIVEKPTTFTVHGLPTDKLTIRNPRRWQKQSNALIESGGEKYEIEYKHVADGEAAGQVPHI